MKTEDLMRGDWVYLYSTPCRVRDIIDDGVINYEKDVNPIPLTPEILEKNGFKKYDGGGYIIKELTDDEMPSLYIWDGNYSLCIVDFYSSNRYTDIKNCKYVHELQHELKSCGINKKIKL